MKFANAEVDPSPQRVAVIALLKGAEGQGHWYVVATSLELQDEDRRRRIRPRVEVIYAGLAGVCGIGPLMERRTTPAPTPR